MELIQSYDSPRWSNEIFDCSMPMTFDTYSKCSYHCLYCFSFFQKSHITKGYDSERNLEKQIRSVNPKKIIQLFDNVMANNAEKMSKSNFLFFQYIQARRIMQWGGLADGFDEWERRFGITLELLKYFDSIDYPLSFSTKAAWWTKDARYMELFKKHTHNWHVKISIITADKIKSRALEKGVPTPEQRLDAIKRLSDIGIHVTLRLRPYIIGVSEDWQDLIFKARQAGADSVTVEFFCLESRADNELKSRYAEMSDICNFDIWDFYMKYSPQNGYKRLDRKIKAPIIYKMRDYAHKLGMRFHVSDSCCRECNDSCNCCGVPPEWNVRQKGHIGQAIIIAREKGMVKYSDIADDVNVLFGKIKVRGSISMITEDPLKRALNYDNTIENYIRNNWNNIYNGTSPAKMYGGILIPFDVDDNGDVVYEFNKEMWKRNAEKS